MKHLIKYVLLTASRDKLFIGTLCLLLITICGGAIFGSTSLIEEAHSATALVGGAASYIIVFGMITFISFHIKNAYENKEIELFLTKPISRTKFLASYVIGYIATAFFVILPFLIAFIALKNIGLFYGATTDYVFWAGTLFLEVILISIFTVFASLILKSAVIAVLVSCGFYVFAKVIGVLLILLNNPYAMGVNYSLGWYAKKLLYCLTLLFPRLDMYAQSSWLIYGTSDMQYGLVALLATTFVYGVIIFGMMLYDFNRQEF